MKKGLAFTLVFVLLLTALAPLAVTASGAERGKISYGALTMFSDGPTITAAHIECSLTGYEEVNGEMHAIAMVTTEGTPNITSIIDLDEQKVLHKYEHTDFGGYAYKGDVHSDGRMILGAGNDLIQYNPNTKEFKYLGTPPMNWSGMYGDIVVDEERDVIFTTESNRGNVSITNMTTGKSSVLVNMASYWVSGSSIGEYGDYLYTSGSWVQADGTANLWKIHKDSGQVQKIENPTKDEFTVFSYTRAIGKYIITVASYRGGGSDEFIYDTETGKWSEFDKNYDIKGSMISDVHDGKRMFINAKNSRVCTIDENLNIVQYDVKFSNYLRGTGPWVKINNPKLPGYSAVTAQYSGYIHAINLETNSIVTIDCDVPAPGLPHRYSCLNPMDDMLYVGAFKGGAIAAVDTNTGVVRHLPAGQPEGMTYDPKTGYFYHGDYTSANIYEINTQYTSKSFGAVGSSATGYGYQDRPFDLEVVDRELYIATLANGDKNTVTGALSVIDLNSGNKTVWEGIIPNQSPVTITHSGRYLYGGTSVNSCNDYTTAGGAAKIFKFDTETKTLVKSVDFAISGVSGDIAICRMLEISPDGSTLYGGTDGVIFKMNPDTLEITDYNIYNSSAIPKSKGVGRAQAWHEAKIIFDNRTGYGFLSGRFGGVIFDPDTLEIVANAPDYGFLAGIDSDGDAWFVQDTTVYKASIIREVPPAGDKTATLTYKNGDTVVYTDNNALNSVTSIYNSLSSFSDKKFCGWEDGNGKLWQTGEQYTVTDDMTFTAKWAEKYTLHFETNGGSAIADKVEWSDTDIVISSYTTQKDNFVFEDWYEDKELTKKITYNFKLTENKTIFAKWRKNDGGGGGGGGGASSYTLTFNTTGGSKVSSISVSEGKTVDLSKYTPTKDGYSFAGWFTDSNLSNQVKEIKITKTTTVYAKWTAVVETKPNYKPDILTDEHYAYIVGRDGGMIAPTRDITRAEVATIIYRLLKEDVTNKAKTTENVFKDVNDGDWFVTEVSTLASLDIVKGRGLDTFAPRANITRSELVTIFARMVDVECDGKQLFNDITGHWAESYINEAATAGWIVGYNDMFRPNDNITRAEVMTMVNNVLNRKPETRDDLLDGMLTWVDNADENAWYYLSVQEATNSHTYEMKADGEYEKWTALTENLSR